MKQAVTNFLAPVLRRFGYKLNRLHAPASEHRPMGDVGAFLEDVRARGLDCRGVIDVGANAGGFTRTAMAVFPQARYLLIEPQSEMKPHFEALKQQSPNVEYVIAGAGSQPGELVQTLYKNTTGSTFLDAPDETALREGRQRKVPIVTLDGLLATRDFEPTMVHIDAQGFELEVLKGASRCFGRTEVFIVQMATMPFKPGQPTVVELFNLMESRGYAFYDISWIMRRPRDGALGLLDFAFVPVVGKLRASNSWL